MGHTIATGGEPPRLDHVLSASGTSSSERRATLYAPMTPLSLVSLVDSYDHSRHLFSHQLYEGSWREIDSIYPHETLTSSCISLIGISRAGIDPAPHGIDPQACLDAIAAEFGRTGYVGGIGLALWANAVTDGDRSGIEFLGDIGLSLRAITDDILPTLTTMETAWCASGLLHELVRNDDEAVRAAATTVTNELRTNRYSASTRLMNHAGRAGAALDRARAHVANFADQIYSVQAFAFASIVLDDHAALVAGRDLAQRHCELQGELGQWWWHYDARRGHVALRYAVYSVHQHGMAPMALFAIAEAGAADLAPLLGRAIDASIAWIDHNELGESMTDTVRSTIWRSIERVESPLTSRVRGGLEALGVADTRPADVRLNRETRPYEWAWCLYAAAISNGLPKGRSLA